MTIAQMQQVADTLNAADVGYDQGQRWSFLDKGSRSIISNRECDCSSSCLGIAWLGGFPVDLSGLAYTGNFAALCRAAGFSVIGFTSFGQLRPGDFLVTPGHHVVFVRDLDRWWSAEVDERGRSAGGQAGDQTGSECRYRTPYLRSGGWMYVVRPPAEAAGTAPIKLSAVTVTGLIVDGDFGAATKRAMQRWLKVPADGIIGKATSRALQARLGVRVDGHVGPVTVRALQQLIGARVDGDWGPDTTRHLQTWLNAQR